MRTPEASFDAIGTRWSIHVDGPLDVVTLARVRSRIAAYDAVWSRFRDDSRGRPDVPRAGDVPAARGGRARCSTCTPRSARCTDGAVSPLVARSLVRLGYDAGYSLRPAGKPEPAPALGRRARARRRAPLVVREPVLLDVGAAGKGQLVDLVAAELRDCGIERVRRRRRRGPGAPRRSRLPGRPPAARRPDAGDRRRGARRRRAVRVGRGPPGVGRRAAPRRRRAHRAADAGRRRHLGGRRAPRWSPTG